MEIVLKRIAKQNTYTIGRMYILKDEEVERKVNYTLNKDQKRSFCHVVDVGKLDGSTTSAIPWSQRGATCWESPCCPKRRMCVWGECRRRRRRR